MSEWISVVDRLPEKDKRVLVCSKYGAVFISRIYIGNAGLFYDDITHWQPLPALPED